MKMSRWRILDFKVVMSDGQDEGDEMSEKAWNEVFTHLRV